MRFVCDSCRAQYTISDDKVGAKGVKVRCKKCGYVILVRRTEDAKPADEGAQTQVLDNPLAALAASKSEGGEVTDPGNGAAPAAPHNGPAQLENPLFGGMEEDEIGAVFDQVLSSGSHKTTPTIDDEDVSTKVIDKDTLLRLAEGSQSAPDDAPSNGPPTTDWYVAIEEKQTGPLTLDKLKDHWDRGEIGPDSLCWRAGFSDWTPLSELRDLTAVLAPKPAKPVIVAPAAQPAVMTVPVESAFSAGGVTKTVRGEMPVLAAAPSAGADDGGWKPSAASALASLVSEEMSALSAKPSAKKAAAPVLAPKAEFSGGLLDVPPAEVSGPQNILSPNMPAASDELPPTANIRRPAPEAVPLTTYRPPTPVVTASGGSKKGLLIAGGVGGVVVIALLAVIAYGLVKPAPAPVQVAERERAPVAVAPAPAPKPVEMPPPPAGMKQVEPQPAVAAAAPAPTPAPAAAVAPAQTKVADARPVEQRPVPVERHSTTSGSGVAKTAVARPMERPSGEEDAITPTRKVADVSNSSDKDFDDLFGGSGDEAPKKAQAKKTVYIPDEPGKANLPETLGQSDIMQVVLNNKPAIVRCVNEQRKKDPSLSGKLVMRWTIQTSGRTSGISVQTDEFKSTYMASCVTGLIKSWSFPRHQRQGDPINFPFTF